MALEREILVRLHGEDYRYEIGDDADGLGLVELRYIEFKDADGLVPITKERITVPPEDAIKIGEALIELANKKLKK
jgi:hypothetical protein